MLKYLVLPLVLLALMSSCASINSVSLTPIPANTGSPIRAEVSKTIILGVNFDNDFINQVGEQLKSQCPNGLVTGILTKDEIYNYFLAHTRRVVATATCVRGGRQRAEVLQQLQNIAEVY